MSQGSAHSFPTGDRRADLEKLKAAAWAPEGREERVARALEAWRQLAPPTFELDAAAWKWIAEDADLEHA